MAPRGLAGLLAALRVQAAPHSRGFAGKARVKAPRAPAEEAQELRATMRRLAFLVHPDRFSALPAAAAQNADSLTLLNGLLATVQKSRDSHPPAAVRTLRFTLLAADGSTREVQSVLRTTGGDCRRVVERALGDLFEQCGLPRAFRWSDGDWDVLSEEKRAARDNRGDSSPEVVQAEPEPAASSTSSQPQAQAQSRSKMTDEAGNEVDLATALTRMDPLLEAVAAVPWLPFDAEGAARRHYIITTVLAELEVSGWPLQRGCHKIWAGARNVDALLLEEAGLGLDAATQQALKAVAFHTRNFEAELGPLEGAPPTPP